MRAEIEVVSELQDAKESWNKKDFLSAGYNYWHGYVKALEWVLEEDTEAEK